MPDSDDPVLKGQLPFELGHDPSHAEADFLVGDSNRMAHAHILAFPNWPGPLSLVTGPAKSGKSHLARIWVERSSALTPGLGELERLATDSGDQPVLIEDIDTIAYDEASLFHLLNQSMRDGRPVLMTARSDIAEWPYRTNDLLSRARLASRFELSLADDIQLSQVFAKLFSDRQVTVDPRIIGYLVARMERSPEEAVVLVGLMDRLALARGTAINRTIAAEALALRSARRDDDQLQLDLGDDPESD